MEHTSHLQDNPALLLERSVFKTFFFKHGWKYNKWYRNHSVNTVKEGKNQEPFMYAEGKEYIYYMFKLSNQWIYTFISDQIWRVQVKIREEEQEKVNQNGQEFKMTVSPAAGSLGTVIVLFALGEDLKFGKDECIFAVIVKIHVI